MRFKYFGDIDFHPLSEVERKEIKNVTSEIKGLKTKDLLAYGSTNMNPEYKILLFVKNSKKLNGQDQAIKMVQKDTVENKVVYKKVEGDKVAYLFLQAINSNKSAQSVTIDGSNLMESLSLTAQVKEELTYAKVFSSNQDNPNHLYVRNQLLDAPIPLNQNNEWMQFQYLTTVNSFMFNNEDYDALIKNFEDKRLQYLKPILGTLRNNEQIKIDDEVLNEISNLAADTRVVMLNENHWYPKHRLLGMKLLKRLREKGYTHLALEALYQNQDSLVNSRKFPILESGYYTREVYFGHFIRRAKELGFTITGYENQDDGINREIGQAQNLIRILEEDIDNKIFVYAGLDHIIEEPTEKGVWMAGHLKKITDINPLTINQVDVISKEKNELMIIPFELLKEKEKFQKPVDYFVINNLEPTLNEIYHDEVLQEVTIEEEILGDYINEVLLVNVYNSEEYQNFRSRAIPIKSSLRKISVENAITVELPRGSYVVKIFSGENKNVLLKEIKL